MAATRSYRDDLQRPHCGSNWLPKDGRSRGKQTYRCRLCHYRFHARWQPPLLLGTSQGTGHRYVRRRHGHSRHQPGSGGQAGDGVRMGQKKSGGP